LSLVFVIFSITFLTFIVGYLAPGDPILVLLGPRRDPQIYNNLRHLYGLDQPWYKQYFDYVTHLLQGNLGMSYRYQNRSVNTILGNGVWVSIRLGVESPGWHSSRHLLGLTPKFLVGSA
jgi:ABC-type dipeptide/oligopeptide/nickel transport system permease component